MKTRKTDAVKEVFQEIADIVTKTMGPRGRMAVIKDEFSRPILTDDGVTVARECMKQDDDIRKMIAVSMIEASNNTEKHAFDGTTLTVLLTNELYKCGMDLINKKVHPQIAADIIQEAVAKALKDLKESKIEIKDDNDKLVRDIANITTKIPAIGDLVYEAYKHAGKAMNIVIEHDREHEESSIEHVDGMILDSGYFTPSFKQLCDEEGKWTAENAKVFLLSEGILTVNGLKGLFNSLEDLSTPLVFVVDKNFSPETMKGLIDNLNGNHLKFMMVFINDANPGEVFLDIAARTNGKIQDATIGTTDYRYEHAGTVDKIIVEQDKTTIISKGDRKEIERRLTSYRKELSKNEYTTGYIRANIITRRMSNLDKGLTKIKIATPSVTEFRTIKFKLDDAIGAVRCACRDGVVLGGGKTLYKLGESNACIRKALEAPMKTIISNAGFKFDKQLASHKTDGLNAKTGLGVDLLKEGIVDSYTSIESALLNASSIACNYLRAYIIIA